MCACMYVRCCLIGRNLHDTGTGLRCMNCIISFLYMATPSNIFALAFYITQSFLPQHFLGKREKNLHLYSPAPETTAKRMFIKKKRVLRNVRLTRTLNVNTESNPLIWDGKKQEDATTNPHQLDIKKKSRSQVFQL